MTNDREQQRRQKVRDVTAAAMSELQETDGLRHLYGQRLDLSDDSPEWFVHQLLKREGLAPPIVEQGHDIDRAKRAAHEMVEKLRARRDWLGRPGGGYTVATAIAFNDARERVLREYRETLQDLNRAIISYNLSAPSALHRRGVRVERSVEQAVRDVPPLPIDTQRPAASPPRRSRVPWRRSGRDSRANRRLPEGVPS
jgi:hypothetical protein